MSFKTGIHIHTRESSECSEIFAKEIVKEYKIQGYKTIIITDHCYQEYFQNKILQIGIKKEDLINTPLLYNYTLLELRKWCKQKDFLIIQAHPYREKGAVLA